MDLSKLIIEGFEIKNIREKLRASQVAFKNEEGSINLLEKMINIGSESSHAKKLDGLRTVQLLRTKAKGHSSGSEAKKLADKAIRDYGSFRDHYQYVCSLVVDELSLIEKRFLEIDNFS